MRGEEEPRYEEIESELVPTIQKEIQRRMLEMHDLLKSAPQALPHREATMKILTAADEVMNPLHRKPERAKEEFIT